MSAFYFIIPLYYLLQKSSSDLHRGCSEQCSNAPEENEARTSAEQEIGDQSLPQGPVLDANCLIYLDIKTVGDL